MKWLENGPKMAKVSTIDSTDIVVSDAEMLKQADGRFTVWPNA
jgi:hypothetical protein